MHPMAETGPRGLAVLSSAGTIGITLQPLGCGRMVLWGEQEH